MKILFYGAQSYDKDSFNLELPKYPDVSIDYIESNLTPMTAGFAKGYDAVCAFVNADASILTLEILAGFDVKLLLMRCAGFDAVDVNAAKDLGITVTRVPAYSPEAIVLHLLLTVVFTVVTSEFARITSRLLALLAIHFTVKLLELLELVVLAQHFAVSAKALACTSLAQTSIQI